MKARFGKLEMKLATKLATKLAMTIGLMTGLMFSAPALAAIGIVDLQAAIQGTKAGKKAKETMDAEYKKRKTALDKRRDDIEKMAKDLQSKRSLLSDEVFSKKNLDIEAEMGKFQKSVKDNQDEIHAKEKEVVEPILKKMKSVIEETAKKKKLELVMDKQSPGLLYTQDSLDMTDEVVKAFEKEK